MSTEFQYDVFLSHNQADGPRVRRLAERLRAAALRQVHFGLRIADFGFAVESALSLATLGSDWVGLERSTGGRGNLPFRDPANAGRRFIPRWPDHCPAHRRFRVENWANWIHKPGATS